MATINVTPGKQFADGEKWTRAGLNQLGTPAVELEEGSVLLADLSTAVQTSISTVVAAIVGVIAKNADFTITSGQKGRLFDVTTAGSDKTATLPAPVDGFYCWIRKADTASGKVLTSPTTSPNAFSLAKQDQKALIYSDGTNYYAVVWALWSDATGKLFTGATFFGLGGNDATSPGFKKNGTTLLFRLGDDSADAPIQCSDATFSGRARNNGYIDLGNITGATSISCALGNRFKAVLTGNVTITLTNMVEGQPVTLALKQDGTGSRTVAWSGITWPGASAPTQTSTANKRDFYSFETYDSLIFGAQVAANYA